MLILQRNKRRIEQQKTELAALNSTKDKLFALLSHDLLSPLANLKNIMMLVDWGMMSQEEFVVVSKKLVNNVNNLYSMFENVLHWSISQMQGIKPKFEQVNISEVVNEQITLFEPIAKSKNICIEQAISTDFVLCIDKNHLALIIRNLLQNALKFTNSGGSIVFNSQNTEGGAKLIIQDTGIGMTPDILAKLFKIDQTVKHKGTAQEGGTGVGLILTKELVIFNRGTIDVASEIGKGTTVVLQFP